MPELSDGFRGFFWSAGRCSRNTDIVQVRGRTQLVAVRRTTMVRRRKRKRDGRGKGGLAWQASCPTSPSLIGQNRRNPWKWVTGKLASGLQVRWWCCTEDTASLLPLKKNGETFITDFYFVLDVLHHFYIQLFTSVRSQHSSQWTCQHWMEVSGVV